jgi:hypothetical protein
MSKVSYPEAKHSEGYYQGGKFDLTELLGDIPVIGPILKTGVDLIRGLLTDNNSGYAAQVTPGTVTTYVPHPEAYRTKSPYYRPLISRQIRYEPEEYED